MIKQHLNEALELGATEAARYRNGWWKVLFAQQEQADMFREYALGEGWLIKGSALVFRVRFMK